MHMVVIVYHCCRILLNVIFNVRMIYRYVLRPRAAYETMRCVDPSSKTMHPIPSTNLNKPGPIRIANRCLCGVVLVYPVIKNSQKYERESSET